jgi:hypothetical protein
MSVPALEVQLNEWSYGPANDRPGYIKETGLVNKAGGPFSIENIWDTIWYSVDDILLYQSRMSGRIFEYHGKDNWYTVFYHFRNSYYEDDSLIVNAYPFYTY